MAESIDVTSTQAADGTWTVQISALEGLPAVSATAPDLDTAGASARQLAVAQVLTEARAEGVEVSPTALALLETRVRWAVSQAALAATSSPPKVTASGFGTDVSTFPDLDPTFTLISGQRAVAEAVARRLLTPQGRLAYAPGDGVDLRGLLSSGFSAARVAALQATVAAEAEKDERVLAADCAITLNAATMVLTVKVRLTTDSGAFTLVLALSQLAADLSVLATA